MRIMAVDYGDARTGLAVSDATGTLAGQALVIETRGLGAAATRIADEAASRGVGVIVVGYPLNMDGSAGPRAQKSKLLAEALREKNVAEVILRDERLTTVDAQRILHSVGKNARRQKKTVDAVAAALILEGYLNSLGG